MRPSILLIGAAVLFAGVAYADAGVNERTEQAQCDEIALGSAPEAIVLVAARLEPLVGIHADILTVKTATGLVGPVLSPAVNGSAVIIPVASTSGGMPG